ncbi:hypothetical protein [Mucilaginibacter sp. L3T2-6]|nr:hypothetical protein [Mucilaginibacter sp. L3T2-6]MDO3640927.1 hypothetical protein [Mucilaginibacter sp. L3T2-6]MDV6213597.1 hypothetical protein [Mucilaginibacter sp. L3T2-6]
MISDCTIYYLPNMVTWNIIVLKNCSFPSFRAAKRGSPGEAMAG